MQNETFLDIILVGVILYWIQPQRFVLGVLFKRRQQLREFHDSMRNQILLNSDILKKNTVEKLQDALKKSAELLKTKADAHAISTFLEGQGKVATAAIPIPPQKKIRENIEIILVAFTIAFAFRALFFQPFKIPTGSMQPTLYGVEVWEETNNSRQGLSLDPPDSSLRRILHSIYYGRSYFDIEIPTSGTLGAVRQPISPDRYLTRYIFSSNGTDIQDIYNLPAKDILGGLKGIPLLTDISSLNIDGKTIEFPARDQYFLEAFGAGQNHIQVTKGQKAKGLIETGDHLLVNRLTYRFREPRRGDITVFETKGITYPNGEALGGQFYIKRLAGLPGDTLRIVGNQLQVKPADSNEFINAQELTPEAYTNIYSGKGDYHGHQADGFLSAGLEVKIPEDSFFMLGDNSANSADSRSWGFVPRKNLSGTAAFVFWPFSRRWGIADHESPRSWQTPDKFFK